MFYQFISTVKSFTKHIIVILIMFIKKKFTFNIYKVYCLK
jgi:hypothetical protein